MEEKKLKSVYEALMLSLVMDGFSQFKIKLAEKAEELQVSEERLMELLCEYEKEVLRIK